MESGHMVQRRDMQQENERLKTEYAQLKAQYIELKHSFADLLKRLPEYNDDAVKVYGVIDIDQPL